MKIEIVERGYKVGDRLKRILNEKLSKFDRYFEDGKAKVVCLEDHKDGGNNYKMEITITAKGMMYRSEVFSDNMFENIDLALPKIERQVIKVKEKNNDKKLNAPADLTFAFLTEAPKFETKGIAKVKTFELLPMSVEEAQLNLESLEHEFYIFMNDKTGTASVVYKRKDGQYGLINTI